MTALIELYANNAQTVLASSITSSATSLTVSPGSGAEFPTPVSGTSFFRVVLTGASSPNTVEEICYVTARSGDTFTVQRGQEGTTAVAWSVNDLIYNAVTAGTLSQFMQRYYGADTSASNDYVISNYDAAGAYYAGQVASFASAYSNTVAAPTLNVNGLGARTIKNADGTALVPGQIESNTIQLCYYNISDTSWRLQNPSYGQVISNLGYVPVNKGGDSMSGALTNYYGFVGPLTGDVTGNCSGNSSTTSQTNFSNLTIAGSQVLAASNYNTYAPTLSGGAAYGSWSIDISGNASTATLAATATVAGRLTGSWDFMPSGTRILFYQASAPLGWTQVTSVNDAAIRVVSGVGGGSVSGNNFSSTFVSQAVSGSVSISGITGTVGDTALNITQLPTHTHGVTDPGHLHGVNDPSHRHQQQGNANYTGGGDVGGGIGGRSGQFGGVFTAASTTGIYLSNATTGISIQNAGSGATHTHSLTVNPATGSFTGNSIPMNVKYIDVIICNKT